ncbi:MAG: YceH family protein [Pirellulaceae bacterium]
MNTEIEIPASEQAERRWRPLTAIQRRVAGVLVEKAKTTPDAYPLTLNALTNGCNQKSNRSPHMELSSEDVERTVEELREMGAVAEVQSGGRVPKYRHYLYEWMGVDKAELAVMAELLLRGEQTIGELRGHAARMEPIADLNALHPIVEALIAKQLVVSLTPPGRGQVITHNLYTPERLEELQDQYAAGRHVPEPDIARAAPARSSGISLEQFAALESELADLRTEVARISGELHALRKAREE